MTTDKQQVISCAYTGHNPVCPHCGLVERDAWEINFPPGVDDTTHDCNSCGEPYCIVRQCGDVTYSVGVARPVKGKGL